MKILERTSFGNPILRQVARRLTVEEIGSPEIQQLIEDMYFTLAKKKYGVGLAAPQVGRSVAISAIHVQPVPWRPDVVEFKLTVINPEIVATYGRRQSMWEGCISFCGDQKDFPYAKTSRFKRVRVRYLDEQGQPQEADFDGLVAQILQHETDHLNGILFVDRVRDNTTFITSTEYSLRYRKKSESTGSKRAKEM
jgi:peptide deformylase